MNNNPGDFAPAMLRHGRRLSRAAWGDKEKFIFLVNGSQFPVNREPLISFYSKGSMINYQQHIDIQNGRGNVSVWSPAQGDILADDWFIVEGNQKNE